MDDDTMVDDKVAVLKPTPYHRPPGAASPPPDDAATAALPGLADPYKAAGTPENNEVSRLVLVMGKDGFKPGGSAYIFVQYVHLSLGEFGFDADGQWFRFGVADFEPKMVKVCGYDILRLADYISLRRLPWIRQADRDFRPPGGISHGPVITRIDVTDWMRLQG
jgi:hypothetical protein